jgi:hypothetical protein
MRRVLFYFITLVYIAIVSCDGTDREAIEEIPTKHSVLGKYGINDSDIDELYSYLEQESEAWLMASKNNKRWLSLYNKNTYKLIQQWSIPKNTEYNTINIPLKTETGYIFTVRTMYLESPSKNLYVVTADNNKESVELIYTLTEKDWLNSERGPERREEIPKLESFKDFIYIHNKDITSPVFRELLINKQGTVVNDVSQTVIGNSVYFAGFYNEKVWVGIFNADTKDKIDEWTANETFNRVIPIYDGSENYYIRSILIDNLNLIETSKGVSVAIRYSKEVGSKDFTRNFGEVLGGDIIFLNSDEDKIIVGKAGFLSFANITDKEHFSLQKWEEENLIFKIRKNFSSEYSTFIFSPEGVLLEEM